MLAQVQPTNFWSLAHGTSGLTLAVIGGLVVGLLVLFALMQAPPQARKGIVSIAVFLSGLYYVLYYVWPKPVDLDANEIPQGGVEVVGKFLGDGLGVVVNLTNVISSFLIGLGLYSLLSVHGKRLIRRNKDWGYSAVLIGSMFLIAFFGYADWLYRQNNPGPGLDLPENWTLAMYARDFLFDGLLQQMDAAMFSLIAFYILSAAYRAFRIRSIEATILLATALLVILSLMGLVQGFVDGQVDRAGLSPNFKLVNIATFVQDTFQTPSIRGIGFGVGIGALAMGLRIWLSLERAGGAS